MDLAEFMKAVGVRPTHVARDAGVDLSIIVRVRDHDQVPSGITLLRLNKWADDLATRKRLPKEQRLTWDYVLKDDDAARRRKRRNGKAA